MVGCSPRRRHNVYSQLGEHPPYELLRFTMQGRNLGGVKRHRSAPAERTYAELPDDLVFQVKLDVIGAAVEDQQSIRPRESVEY